MNATLPNVVNRCWVLPIRADTCTTSVTCSQIKYVAEIDTQCIETFVGIIHLPKKNPRDLRYRQLARLSMTETTMAAGPPYRRNVRKTAASEKLIANRDRGSVRLIRGPTRVEKAITRKNP